MQDDAAAKIPELIFVHPPHTTPLPRLSMTVISIAMLAEFLTGNVSTPYLLFQVTGFSCVSHRLTERSAAY